MWVWEKQIFFLKDFCFVVILMNERMNVMQFFFLLPHFQWFVVGNMTTTTEQQSDWIRIILENGEKLKLCQKTAMMNDDDDNEILLYTHTHTHQHKLCVYNGQEPDIHSSSNCLSLSMSEILVDYCCCCRCRHMKAAIIIFTLLSGTQTWKKMK